MRFSILIVGRKTAASLEMSYSRALEHLGCQVSVWSPEDALGRAVRCGRLGQLFSSYVNVEAWLRRANLELIQLAGKLHPNLILVIGTEGVRAGTLGQLRAQLPQTKIYCIFPDTPHNLITDRILCLPLFDRFITVSPGWVDSFKRLGAVNVSVLPLAADTQLHTPVDFAGCRSSSAHDVAFVGNWRAEREEFLEQLVDFDLAIWGSDYWKRRTRRGSPVSRRWMGKPLVGRDFARACTQNRILLNIIDGVAWPGPNMRTFEQPACRAFSLVSRTPAVAEIFEEGKTIECFDSVDEARDKISFYLRSEPARERISNQAYEFVVRRGHTYFDRAKQLLTWGKEDELW